MRASAIWLVILAGTVVAVALAFATTGQPGDMESFRVVAGQLKEDPLHLYGAVNGGGSVHWPYPPGFFPAVLLADGAAGTIGLPFHGWIQLPAIAADAGIAWLVQDELGRRGRGTGARLAAASLVALGPSFLIVSGYHGQIDAVAILAGLAGLVAWERAVPRRALVAGLLIGLGAAVKTVPFLLVLVLLPRARSWREGAALLTAAVAVPLVALAPFLAAGAGDVLDALSHTGVPGAGGLSLALQPDLAGFWINERPLELSAASDLLRDARLAVNAGAAALAGGILAWRRPAPARGAVVLWLVVYALATSYLPQYLLWGLPFFLLAGFIVETAWLQALVLAPTVLFYAAPFDGRWVGWVYAVLMLAAWASLVVAALLTVRRLSPPRRPSRTRTAESR